MKGVAKKSGKQWVEWINDRMIHKSNLHWNEKENHEENSEKDEKSNYLYMHVVQ